MAVSKRHYPFTSFLTLTLSVIVEAVPFLILGTIISALIRRFTAGKAGQILPKNALFRRLVLSIAGLALPVHGCGDVPVARSLLARGLKPADVVSFLFARANPLNQSPSSYYHRLLQFRAAYGFGGYFALVIVPDNRFHLFQGRFHHKSGFKSYCRSHKHNSNLPELFVLAQRILAIIHHVLAVGAIAAQLSFRSALYYKRRRQRRYFCRLPP